VGSNSRAPSVAYVGGGIIVNPLPIENPATMAANTSKAYFASLCPIYGLFFTCNNLVLTSCGCTYHPFCLNVHMGGKHSRKCVSQICGECFLEEWFNNWGVNQISL
jgi:hypothetical protein